MSHALALDDVCARSPRWCHAPRHQVGDLVFVPTNAGGYNTRLVSVNPNRACLNGWQEWVPGQGAGSYGFSRANPNAPTRVYVNTGWRSWRYTFDADTAAEMAYVANPCAGNT